MTTENPQAAEKVALTDAERIAAVLDEHHLSFGGRNLGQYRTEWSCVCGATFVTDGHKGESVRDGNNAHLASVLADRVAEAVEQERAAWAAKVEVLADTPADCQPSLTWTPPTAAQIAAGLRAEQDVEADARLAKGLRGERG